MMYYVCHDRRGHKLRHNVGTCLRHVSMQTTMYQGIGGAASCESSTLCAYLICLRKQKWTETPFCGANLSILIPLEALPFGERHPNSSTIKRS